MDVRLVDVDARPRRSPRRPASPCPTTLTTTCMIAPRSRTEPALPTTSRGSPSRERRSTAPSCSSSGGPGASDAPLGFRSYSPSMLFRWMPVPGHDHARAGAGRRRERRGVAVRVDDRDVRRAAGRRGLRLRRRAGLDPVDAPRAAFSSESRCRASPPWWSRVVKRSPRARPCSRITSTSAVDAPRREPGAPSRRAGRAARARRRSARRPTTAADSTRTRSPGTRPARAGARSRGSARRSSAVIAPPVSRRCRTIAAASSPS